MFSDETLFDIVGSSEYEPSLPQPQKHRQYLHQSAKFKQAISITIMPGRWPRFIRLTRCNTFKTYSPRQSSLLQNLGSVGNLVCSRNNSDHQLQKNHFYQDGKSSKLVTVLYFSPKLWVRLLQIFFAHLRTTVERLSKNN